MRSRSSSTTSSKSNSNSLPPDNVQIFVKISGDKTIPLNVQPINTISNVLEFLSASTTLPADVQLVHAGHRLSPSTTVGELNLQPSATLQLLTPIRGGNNSPAADPELSSLEVAKDMTASLIAGGAATANEAKSEPSQPSSSPASKPLLLPSPTTAASSSSATVKASTPSTASSTPRSGTPSTTVRKSNKPRCLKTGCKAAAQPIVGDCGFCQKRFCGKHRMLESHACTGLDDARQADKDRNTAKLQGEATVMLRGLH